MDHTETKKRRVSTYQGVVVDLTEDIVSLPNGATSVREVVHHPGGVCVAAVDDERNVFVVRQWRYPFGRELLELPAGKLETGEDPLPAAQRELSEETGLEADKWEDLGCIYVSPAHPDPNEFLDVEKMPLSKLAAMAMDGTVHDAKTVVGALKALSFLGRN